MHIAQFFRDRRAVVGIFAAIVAALAAWSGVPLEPRRLGPVGRSVHQCDQSSGHVAAGIMESPGFPCLTTAAGRSRAVDHSQLQPAGARSGRTGHASFHHGCDGISIGHCVDDAPADVAGGCASRSCNAGGVVTTSVAPRPWWW